MANKVKRIIAHGLFCVCFPPHVLLDLVSPLYVVPIFGHVPVLIVSLLVHQSPSVFDYLPRLVSGT